MLYSLLYITPLWLMNFIIGSFYLLILFTFLTYLPTSLSFGNHQFLLCTSEKMWIHTYTHTHTGILLSNKKEWSLAICNNTDGLEGMILSRVSQTDAVWFHLYVESKKNWTKKAKQKQAHRHREQIDVCMCPLREKKPRKAQLTHQIHDHEFWGSVLHRNKLSEHCCIVGDRNFDISRLIYLAITLAFKFLSQLFPCNTAIQFNSGANSPHKRQV